MLGLDSVRVFVPFHDFGGEIPKEEKLLKLERLLDLANEQKLRVVITLFDGRVDHRPARWPGDEFHLQTVIARLRSHPALAMWDVKNQPELDDGVYASKLEVRAWLAHMISTVRSLDPNTPITIGWATAENAADRGMSELVDVVSFHWYQPIKGLRTAIKTVRATALGRPIVISEYGLPTWNSMFPGGHTEPEQAAYYADLLTIAAAEGVNSAMAWTLHDLKFARDESKLPWNVGPQTNLGILRADGSPKPAAATLKPGANLDAVPRMGLMNRWDKTFWKLIFFAIVAMLTSVFSVSGLRRRRRKRLVKHPKQNTFHGEIRAFHSNSSAAERSTN
jgi:endo-1,4-beta-mannosidase